jgi:hypothetical protein
MVINSDSDHYCPGGKQAKLAQLTIVEIRFIPSIVGRPSRAPSVRRSHESARMWLVSRPRAARQRRREPARGPATSVYRAAVPPPGLYMSSEFTGPVTGSKYHARLPVARGPTGTLKPGRPRTGSRHRDLAAATVTVHWQVTSLAAACQRHWQTRPRLAGNHEFELGIIKCAPAGPPPLPPAGGGGGLSLY